MTTTYKLHKYRYNSSSRGSTSSTSWSSPILSPEQTVIMEKFDRPETVYRKMPSDLWGAATNREVIRETTRTSFGTHYTNSGLNRRVGIAAIDVYTEANVSIAQPFAPFPIREAMYNQIRKDLRGKSVNLALCLAEYKKTALLFRDAAKLLTTNTEALVRGAAGTAKSSKEISRRWLQYQYGVRPLANEILTSIELMKSPRVQNLYMTGRIKRGYAYRATGTASQNSTTSTRLAQAELIRSGAYYSNYRAKFSGGAVRSTLIQSGFANPFNLAWELIPFSFVVDWWINIGDVLASLDNLLLFDSLWVRDSYHDIRGLYVTANNANFTGGWSRLRTSTGRGAPQNVSMISRFRYKPSVSQSHILNGTALMRLQMKR